MSTGSSTRPPDEPTRARARELEAIGFVQSTVAAGEKMSWTGGVGIVA